MHDLPKPIADYFMADRSKNAETVAKAFTENAIVVDERQTYKGRPEIQRWKRESSTKYEYTSEPFAIETLDGRIVVTSHLVGNFKGSPLDLRYFFVLEGDKIASLEIIP
jgi:hypothetical protein